MLVERAADNLNAVRPVVAESNLHRSMKCMVRAELESEGYLLVEEPLHPPTRRISWSSYRPDLLGFRRDSASEEIVIVECETRPSMNRFRAKNYSGLWFQTSILRDGRIRRILAVPSGRLDSVDLRLRDEWEVWVLGAVRPVMKLGTLGSAVAVTAAVPTPAAPAAQAHPAMESSPLPNRVGTTRR